MVPAKVSRLAVLAFVYLAMLGLIAGILIAIGSRIAEEAAVLAGKLPDALKQDPVGNLWLPGWLEPARGRLAELLQNRISELDQQVLPLLTRAGTEIVSGLGTVLSLVLVPILGFFFVKDGARMRRETVALFTPDSRVMMNDILEDLHHMLARYIRRLGAALLGYVPVSSGCAFRHGLALRGAAGRNCRGAGDRFPWSAP